MKWKIFHRYQQHPAANFAPGTMVPLVLLIPVANFPPVANFFCRWCQQNRWQIAPGINDTGGKNDNFSDWKFFHLPSVCHSRKSRGTVPLSVHVSIGFHQWWQNTFSVMNNFAFRKMTFQLPCRHSSQIPRLQVQSASHLSFSTPAWMVKSSWDLGNCREAFKRDYILTKGTSEKQHLVTFLPLIKDPSSGFNPSFLRYMMTQCWINTEKLAFMTRKILKS
jgi:hypothetical protein